VTRPMSLSPGRGWLYQLSSRFSESQYRKLSTTIATSLAPRLWLRMYFPGCRDAGPWPVRESYSLMGVLLAAPGL
jgi:hypothetical protein